MELDGVASGNWGYVWAAWGISLSMLGTYGVLVILRLIAAQSARSRGQS